MKKLNMKTLVSLILVAVSTVLIVISASVTLAKYVSEHSADETAEPKSFYFESDLLKLAEEGAGYYVGLNEIRIELMNYADELRLSDVDITYTVTLTESGAEEASEPKGGTFAKDVPESDTIVFSGLTYGKTYTVTATSTVPYKKTLTATFTVYDEQNSVSYRVYESEEYGDNVVYIEVKTNEISKLVNVYWQNGYVPDNSYVPMSLASGTVALDVELSAYSTHVLRFFKSDGNVTFDSSRFFIEIVIDSVGGNVDNDNISSDVTDVEGEWN